MFFDSEIKSIIKILNLCVYTLIFGDNRIHNVIDSALVGFYISILFMKGNEISEKLIIQVFFILYSLD